MVVRIDNKESRINSTENRSDTLFKLSTWFETKETSINVSLLKYAINLSHKISFIFSLRFEFLLLISKRLKIPCGLNALTTSLLMYP